MRSLTAAFGIVVIPAAIVVLPIVYIRWTFKNDIRRFQEHGNDVADLIAAIKRYKADKGAYPSELTDLRPKYAASVDAPGWSYGVIPPPDDSAMFLANGPWHSKLVYFFPSVSQAGGFGEWQCTSEGDPIPIEVELPDRPAP